MNNSCNCNDEHLDDYLNIIMLSISIENPVKVFYFDFLNVSVMQTSIKMFQSTNSQIAMGWIHDLANNTGCQWEDGVYLPEYKYLDEYFNNLTNYNWRKMCIGRAALLYLQNEDFDVSSTFQTTV